MPSILSTHLVLQTSLSLCFKDSGQYSSILSLRQFLCGTHKVKKYEIFLILVIRFQTRCSPQEPLQSDWNACNHRSSVCKVLLDVLRVHALITLISYLQLLLTIIALSPTVRNIYANWNQEFLNGSIKWLTTQPIRAI